VAVWDAVTGGIARLLSPRLPSLTRFGVFNLGKLRLRRIRLLAGSGLAVDRGGVGISQSNGSQAYAAGGGLIWVGGRGLVVLWEAMSGEMIAVVVDAIHRLGVVGDGEVIDPAAGPINA